MGKLLLLAAIPIIGFVVGVTLGRIRPSLSDEDHKELVELREMREDLMAMAAEHSLLGDSFAPLAFERMKNTRRKR